MNKHLALAALLAVSIAAPAMASTHVSIGVGFNMPPPLVVYRQEPRWVMVPNERVYYVDDDNLGYDYFRYGGWYWIYENDSWYRAHRYNGPFVAVRSEYVPAPIWRVGYRDHYRWRHRPSSMPPGIAKKYYGDRDRYADWDRHDNGRGNGRGHGRGRGHGDRD